MLRTYLSAQPFTIISLIFSPSVTFSTENNFFKIYIQFNAYINECLPLLFCSLLHHLSIHQGNFAKKCHLKLLKLFSDHYPANKKQNCPKSCLQVKYYLTFVLGAKLRPSKIGQTHSDGKTLKTDFYFLLCPFPASFLLFFLFPSFSFFCWALIFY